MGTQKHILKSVTSKLSKRPKLSRSHDSIRTPKSRNFKKCKKVFILSNPKQQPQSSQSIFFSFSFSKIELKMKQKV